MGLAKVLLGFSRDAGLSKCARVDSLGLAKRRLAVKAAQEDIVIEASDTDEPAQAPVAELPQETGEQDGQDDTDAIFMTLVSLQHRDSLRVHRQKFRQRASLEQGSSRLQGASRRKSWSNSASQRAEGDGDVDDAAEDGEVAPDGSRHVHFRRASDGEYLVRERAKSLEAGPPSALKAVQLKAERLFRRLTAPFTGHVPRSRSATTSRGGSPIHSQRNSNSRAASTTRSSASWVLALRHRSLETSPSNPASPFAAVSSPITAAAAITTPAGDGRTSAGSGFRANRKSASGELFFSVSGSGGSDTTDTCMVAARLTRPPSGGLSPSPAGGAGKGRGWLMRLSRGFSGAGAISQFPVGSKPPVQAPASPPASPPMVMAAPKPCTLAPFLDPVGDRPPVHRSPSGNTTNNNCSPPAAAAVTTAAPATGCEAAAGSRAPAVNEIAKSCAVSEPYTEAAGSLEAGKVRTTA